MLVRKLQSTVGIVFVIMVIMVEILSFSLWFRSSSVLVSQDR